MTSKKPKTAMKAKNPLFPLPYAVYSKWGDGGLEYLDDFVTEDDAKKAAALFIEREMDPDVMAIVVKYTPTYTVAYPKMDPVFTPVSED